MQSGESIKLNFEGLQMQKWNITKNRAQKVDKKLGSFVYFDVYPWSYGHQNVKSGLFFVSSTDDSKKSVTVWAKYFSAPQRFYMALLENAIHYWSLSYY